MKPCGWSEFHLERLTNLIVGFQEARVQGASQPQDDGLGVYGKSTCVKFHWLAIATLLSYGQHLEALQHTDKMNGTDWAQKYKQVWICGFLLWQIVSSHMFQHHHCVLRKGTFLIFPQGNEEDTTQYNNYTHFTTHRCLGIPKAEPGFNTSEAVV